MNVHELLWLLQTEHDETATRAGNLRERIERLTTALAETEARLAELTATRKVIDGLTPPDAGTAPAATVYQHIVTTFNDPPRRCSASMTRMSTSACPPTSPRSTSPTPAWDDSSARDSSNNPDAAAIRNGLNALSVDDPAAASPARGTSMGRVDRGVRSRRTDAGLARRLGCRLWRAGGRSGSAAREPAPAPNRRCGGLDRRLRVGLP
ncbi:hypothetical protein ACE14D_02080 [Streptomyces sp. Act-28]